MRLCDRDIEAWLDEGRLAINPRPPVERINGATVDVRLGNKFRTFRGHTAPFIDLSGPKAEVSAALDRVMSEEIVLPEGEAFFLHPGELALAVTYESVTLPADLVGWLDGRSSLARLGLMVHVTAHRIDPGWSGCIVLEFYNSGKLPLERQSFPCDLAALLPALFKLSCLCARIFIIHADQAHFCCSFRRRKIGFLMFKSYIV